VAGKDQKKKSPVMEGSKGQHGLDTEKGGGGKPVKNGHEEKVLVNGRGPVEKRTGSRNNNDVLGNTILPKTKDGKPSGGGSGRGGGRSQNDVISTKPSRGGANHRRKGN